MKNISLYCLKVQMNPEQGLTVSIFPTHLDILSEAFKGVNIQAFFAGLQTGDNFLGFNAAWSDCQT